MVKMVLTAKESVRFYNPGDKRELKNDAGKGTGKFVTFKDERLNEMKEYAARVEDSVELYLTLGDGTEVKA